MFRFTTCDAIRLPSSLSDSSLGCLVLSKSPEIIDYGHFCLIVAFPEKEFAILILTANLALNFLQDNSICNSFTFFSLTKAQKTQTLVLVLQEI